MRSIAFYAPMKPPDDPVPSGDRTFARALLKALERTQLGEVRLASRLRARDGKGDGRSQEAILSAAAGEIERLSHGARPDLWVTYHSYYKAPDLLGPALSRLWRIPYVLVEATRARKRLEGPYASFAARAEAACDAADAIFYLTEHDRAALERHKPSRQTLIRLRPFLEREAAGAAKDAPSSPIMVACGMFRPGDKLASYRALAAALQQVRAEGWTLRIIGDGPEENTVRALFSGFAKRVTFLGRLSAEDVGGEFRKASLLVWSGVGEAFGMVYLEAQAEGCPVVAEDRPGVRDVVRDGGLLVEPGSAAAFAEAIDHILADQLLRAELGRRGRAQIEAEHMLPAATAILASGLLPLLGDVR